MGQYYRAIISSIKEREVFSPAVAYGCGYKLIEEAVQNFICGKWQNSFFTCGIFKKLLYSPHFVAWVGDYSQELLEKWPKTGKRSYENFPTYQEVWGKNATILFPEKWEEKENDDFAWEDKNLRYLLNFDKQQYVDLKELRENRGGDPDRIVMYSPLPLLTAIGNGLGGGDYTASLPDFDKVGSWAWNLISVDSDVPSGFQKLEVNFREEW